MEDIFPYTCIVQDCPKPLVLYANRNDWMTHMCHDHRKCWECLPCSSPGAPPKIYPTVQDLIEHTKYCHRDSVTDDQISTLVAAAIRPAPFGINRCPLCDVTDTADSDALFDHIAEHIHSFALRSLPWPDQAVASGINYFSHNDYFDDDSSRQSNILSESGDGRDDLPLLSPFGSPKSTRHESASESDNSADSLLLDEGR